MPSSADFLPFFPFPNLGLAEGLKIKPLNIYHAWQAYFELTRIEWKRNM